MFHNLYLSLLIFGQYSLTLGDFFFWRKLIPINTILVQMGFFIAPFPLKL
jgi:hypothetical protein